MTISPKLGRADLRSVVTVSVADQTGRVLAVSTVAGFRSRALGWLRAGAKRRLAVSIGLPADAGNEYAGGSADFDLAWSLDA